MITPIVVDLVLNIVGFSFGLYSLIFKMGAFKQRVYTPKIETLIITAFMLGWSTFGFKAFAVISRYPPWLHDGSDWQGAWSYTFGRAMVVVAFIIMTCVFNKRATTQRCECNNK